MSGLGWECFDRFQYTATDPISSSWTNLNSPYPQGDIELYDFEKWTVPKLRIKSIDTASNIVYLTGPTDQQDFYHDSWLGTAMSSKTSRMNNPAGTMVPRPLEDTVDANVSANTGENPPTDTVTRSAKHASAGGHPDCNGWTFPGNHFEHDNWTVSRLG